MRSYRNNNKKKDSIKSALGLPIIKKNNFLKLSFYQYKLVVITICSSMGQLDKMWFISLELCLLMLPCFRLKE